MSGKIVLKLRDMSAPWQVLGYRCYSIKQAGQTLFLHGPSFSLGPLLCSGMGPACAVLLQPLTQVGPGGSGLPCPWGAEGTACVLKQWKTLDASSPLSLFPLFPFCILHTPMWEMLERFEGSRYCFCGDMLKSCDKAVLLGYSCVTFESFDGNLLLAFVFWCLDTRYVDALNFLSIIRQLILLIFCFLQDY